MMNRRLIALALLLVSAFAGLTPVAAQDFRHGGGRGGYGRRFERGYERGAEFGGRAFGGGGYGGPRDDRGDAFRPRGRWGREGGFAGPGYQAGRGGGFAGGYPPARALGRGQFLPPQYWGAEVTNPGRYHLRRPPNGYGWVNVGPNVYLTQRSTGLILDAVPGGH